MVVVALVVGALAGCARSHRLDGEVATPTDAFVGVSDLGAPRDAGIRPTDLGPTDRGPDAFRPPREEPWGDCVEALVDGRTGDPCAFTGESCSGSDLCYWTSAACGPDRRLQRIGTTMLTTLPTGELCTDTTSMAAVDVFRGDESIFFDSGWASRSRGRSPSASVYLGSRESLTACDSPRIGFDLLPSFETGAASYVGTHWVAVLVTTRSGEPQVLPGVVEIFEEGAGREGWSLNGELLVDHEEWRIEGSFAAVACPALDRTGP